MKEIERKFLVKDNSWKTDIDETSSSLIQQGYLNTDPDRVVRIRIRDRRAYITVKGKPEGITRNEYEYKIPMEEARELLEMCLGKVIIKRRFLLQFMVWVLMLSIMFKLRTS